MYWDPFEEMNRMQEEMDRLFRHRYLLPERQLLPPGSNNKELMASRFSRSPVCHVQETESAIIASFEIPGVNKEDIELYVHDDSIELKVESVHESKHDEKEKKGFMKQQFSFYRAMALPKEVHSEKAVAEYKDGLLRVEIPKKEQRDSTSKRLQIK